MSSKKEEERNEKIIRGLMKLPPNRRCINCDSLGPQYVCTNFWTFICITCSGIHREFTHRVKSVSMAKFTSQEVESLQRGGNQRAREIFLRDWDLQRQRLPSGSVEKVRDFIKHVYVDRKYAGGNTSEKPPKDMQTLRNLEDDTRRASSYHSYSQSPPYEHQYEDRKYGRVLTRRPGSDRGHYEGKLSSFYSPGRLGEQMYEDRFANEGSASRASDYSVSSGGDPFRSDNQSPNFQKDIRGSSPQVLPVRDILVEDAQHRMRSTYSVANAKRDADRTVQPQRTASVGSFGSFASNSMSLKSVNSGGLFDVVSEPEHSTGTQLDRMSTVPSLPQSYVSANSVNVDSFNSSLIQQSASFPVPSIDFFQPQATSSTPPIDLFAAINHQQSSTTSFEQKQPALSLADNEGWATFDLPHHEVSVPGAKNVTSTSMTPVDALPFGNFDAPSINASMQWPSVQSSTAHGPFYTLHNQWHGGSHEVQASAGITSTESWNAFEDSPSTLPQASVATPTNMNEVQAPAYKPPSVQISTAHGPFSSLDNQWHGGSHEVQASVGTTSTESWNAFENSPGTLPQASITTTSPKNEVQVPAYNMPSVQSSTAHESFSSLDNQWHGGSREVQASTGTTSTESWNAFEESPGSLPQASIATSSDKNEAQVPAYKPSSNADQHLSSKISEDTTRDTVQRANLEDRPPVPNTPFNGVINGSTFTPSVFSFMGGMPAHANDRRSINPFDLPYEADLEPTNMFLDMSSLQSALPDIQLQPSFLAGISEPWLPQNSITPYIPATPQDSLGGLSYMAGEAPGPQLPNTPAPGPVASLGGNPFA